MEINREKLSKALQIIFCAVGGLAAVFVILYIAYAYIPRAEDYISSNINYVSNYSDEGKSSYDSSEEVTTQDTEEIKTGQLSIVVDSIDEARNELEEIKSKYDGSITYSYESGDGLDKSLTLTIKVKESDFENAFKDLSEITGDVEYSYTDTNDVTEEYVDLQARLTNLQATEEQLLKIMDEAETVEDTMSVYSELSSVRGQIEELEAQIRYLDSQTDYSYITVTFSLSSTGAGISEDEWKPLGVLKEAFRAFLTVLKGFGNIFIWILVFSPFVLVAFGIYLIVEKVRKSKK